MGGRENSFINTECAQTLHLCIPVGLNSSISRDVGCGCYVYSVGFAQVTFRVVWDPGEWIRGCTQRIPGTLNEAFVVQIQVAEFCLGRSL